MITTEVWFVVTTREGVIIKREYMGSSWGTAILFLNLGGVYRCQPPKIKLFFILSITLHNQKD